MDNRWDITSRFISSYCGSIGSVKKALVDHIKNTDIGRMKDEYTREEYEITSVKITIKKKGR